MYMYVLKPSVNLISDNYISILEEITTLKKDPRELGMVFNFAPVWEIVCSTEILGQL